MTTLDVGSGHGPRGDVNVDVHTRFAWYTPNFVKACGCHLPFRDDTFTEASCIHTIEHVDNPVALLRELLRVTQGIVTIVTPWRNLRLPCATNLCSSGRSPHRWRFTKRWFQPIQRVYPKTEIQYSHAFILPMEITVTIDTRVTWSMKA
jgi:ubiquinone/menaquinone biosynthesis C-methylase UbiE